jgi:hypothetical protein
MAINSLSTGFRPGVCTSSTRPTAPYEGQVIYETDTDLSYVWGGAAWQQVSGGTAVGNSGLVYIGAYSASATTLFIDGCFTSTYTNYVVTVQTTATGATGSFVFKLRASGTAVSTDYYYGGLQYFTNAAATAAQGSNDTSITYSASSGTAYVYGTIQLSNPKVAQPTQIFIDSNSYYSNYAGASIRGHHNLSTAYDGLQITMNTGGTITGTLRVYGVRQA